jgi:glutamate synthase domain-containing protein 3
MTNGLVLVLGACGRNFAAGMSGGLAYVFDEKGDFAEKRCNPGAVDLEPLDEVDGAQLRALVAGHAELTQSPRAKWILDNWNDVVPRFIKVFPHEYKRVLGVSRSGRVYSPGPIEPALVSASDRLEQVQHG